MDERCPQSKTMPADWKPVDLDGFVQGTVILVKSMKEKGIFDDNSYDESNSNN